uniref:Uncharacterized protein n=1 Tax=Knipowitschia caucasica TaxID=637954 RepID=A0AAV2M8U4_KNICA
MYPPKASPKTTEQTLQDPEHHYSPPLCTSESLPSFLPLSCSGGPAKPFAVRRSPLQPSALNRPK